MGCGRLTNGIAPVEKIWRVEASVTGANALSIDWTAPCWCKLLQVTVNIEPAVPINPDLIMLWKDHTGTAYDVILRSVDPSTTGFAIKDWACNEVWYFETGEHIRLDYANTDAQSVGGELYIQRILQ